MLKYQLPRGTRDFLPDDMVVRNHVERIVEGTFESYGFQPIETPTFEQYELLAARSGEEIKESMFTFASDAGRYALRPELTSPVCRMVASNTLHSVCRPYKLYYFGPCFRYCRPQSGRYREFYQAGVELMGSDDALADAETIAVAVKTLSRLGISQFRVRVGDVGIFRHLLEEYLEKDGQRQDRESHVISDINKIMSIREKCAAMGGNADLSQDEQNYVSSVSNTLHKLQEEVSYSGEFEIVLDRTEPVERLPEVADATFRASWVAHGILTDDKAAFLIELSRVEGPADAALEAARDRLSGTSAIKSLEGLCRVCEWLPTLGVNKFDVALGLVRNLDFYTGTVFEVDSPLLDAQRQVCGGGRYDKLVEEFGGPPTPATGFAFGFDRLVEVFRRSGHKIGSHAVDVAVVSPPNRRMDSVELAERLREGDLGLRVAVDLKEREIKEQLTYSENLGAPFVVLVGMDEIDGNQCKLRDRGTGTETTLAISGLGEELRRRIEKGRK
jgi:histidyl-tRNA synthetase